jgi:hypothetical protein
MTGLGPPFEGFASRTLDGLIEGFGEGLGLGQRGPVLLAVGPLVRHGPQGYRNHASYGVAAVVAECPPARGA